MRKLFTIISVIVPLLMSGQTYFKEGMKWSMEVSGTHTPDNPVAIETVTIEKSLNDGSLEMYRSYGDDENSKDFIALVRTEGDKVFFNPQNADDSEWYLFYDFGLKPGEGCLVYSPVTDSKYSTFVKCVGVNETSDYGDWATLSLEEYTDESCAELLGEGIWIKGLSSANGVLDNNRFNVDGASSKLLMEVVDRNKVIYSNESTDIIKVTEAPSIDILVNGLDLSVTVNGDCNGCLYSQSGLILGNYKFNGSCQHIKLPGQGIYFLKIGNTIKKILAQ